MLFMIPILFSLPSFFLSFFLFFSLFLPFFLCLFVCLFLSFFFSVRGLRERKSLLFSHAVCSSYYFPLPLCIIHPTHIHVEVLPTDKCVYIAVSLLITRSISDQQTLLSTTLPCLWWLDTRERGGNAPVPRRVAGLKKSYWRGSARKSTSSVERSYGHWNS